MSNLSDLPFITPEDIAERASEAIVGGELYREAFITGRAQRNPGDIDRWIAEDAARITSGELTRRVVIHGDPIVSYGSTVPRITIEQAERLMGSAIIREAILAGGSR